METSEKAELQHCFYSEREASPTVEIRILEKGFAEELTFRRNEIVFMTEGEVRFIFRNQPEQIHRKGEFIFIPMGGVFRFVVLEHTHITVIRPNGNVNLCAGYPIEELYRADSQASKKIKAIFALEINRPLQLFLDGLNGTLYGGINCRYYFDTKVKEMFILLKSYYSQEQLRNFFSPILTPDTRFSEHVRVNYPKYATVKELANVMNMTPKLFSKKFIKVFGETATDWLRREKAHDVYSDLYAGHEQIARIADKYNFSSQSHLNKFCKREFGRNPGEIRKRG